MIRRRVVVGGASSGLGRAIASAFAAEGSDLLLWSRGRGPLEETAEQLRQLPGSGSVYVLAADASEPDTAAQVSATALEWLGGVDVLVLNAGGPPPHPADRTTADGWRSALQLLTVTPIDLATRLLPSMREKGWGRIVSVLSSGVREPLPELCYSNAGRSALTAWMKTVATTVAADGVTVNGVLPGRIDTERVAQLDTMRAEREQRPVADVRAASAATIPLGRYGTPTEFASLVTYLGSDAASYVTGSFLSCDGGQARGTW